MREDMKWVLRDTYRGGGYENGRDHGKSDETKGARKRYMASDALETPKMESMGRSRRYGWDHKESRWSYSILYKYLHSQVGRPWDDIYRNICQRLDVRSAPQREILHSLENWVVRLHTYIQDGKLYESSGIPLNSSYRKWEFYVHPETKVLCLLPEKKFVRNNKQRYVKGKNENHIYKQIKGIWYEVFLKSLPPLRWNEYSPFFKDVIYGYNTSRISLCEEYGSYNKYAYSKRQLNSKEIKRLIKEN